MFSWAEPQLIYPFTIAIRSAPHIYYLISPKSDIKEVEKRVEAYREWIMVKMYNNSQKSRDFDFFNIHPSHQGYMKNVEENYIFVKDKYKNSPDHFKKIEKAQSFIDNKRKLAKECEIEDLYLAVFSETSATVHIADISDRMIKESGDAFEGYQYKLSSSSESMMLSGISNMLLIKAVFDFCDFFDFSQDTIKEIFKNIKMAKNHLI